MICDMKKPTPENDSLIYQAGELSLKGTVAKNATVQIESTRSELVPQLLNYIAVLS